MRAIWVDPNWWDRMQQYKPAEWRIVTTTTTQPLPAPVDEEQLRRIVREEIADLPIPFDVPDTPPES